MPDVAIISASYGNYEVLKRPLPQTGIDAEWVLVTDNLEWFAEWELVHSDPELSAIFSYGLAQWRVVYDPRPGETPMHAAKHAKLYPWEYTDAPASIWIDGSVKVTSSSFAAETLPFAFRWQAGRPGCVAQFVHHSRDCIYAEAAMSARMRRKYGGQPVLEQADHYRASGHPEHWGLWATTVIARRHTSEAKELAEAWGEEMSKWSFQDQISEPYVLRNTGLQPAAIPGHVYGGNPWLHVLMTGKHLLEAPTLGEVMQDPKWQHDRKARPEEVTDANSLLYSG